MPLLGPQGVGSKKGEFRQTARPTAVGTKGSHAALSFYPSQGKPEALHVQSVSPWQSQDQNLHLAAPEADTWNLHGEPVTCWRQDQVPLSLGRWRCAHTVGTLPFWGPGGFLAKVMPGLIHEEQVSMKV